MLNLRLLLAILAPFAASACSAPKATTPSGGAGAPGPVPTATGDGPPTSDDAEATPDAAVRAAIAQVFGGVDRRDWVQVRAAMTPEIQVNYADLGGPSGAVDADELVAGWSGFLPKFDLTVHQLHDMAVHVVGDRATATFTGIALHGLASKGELDTWTVLAAYDAELVRTDGAWKLARLDLSLRGQAGNLELPKQAMARAGATGVVDADAAPNATVEAFFRALEANDRDALAAVFAPGVVQDMPFAPEGFPRSVRGARDLNALFANVIALPQRYRRTHHATPESRFAVVSFEGEVEAGGETPYRNSYVNVFEIDDSDRIVRIVEHFDPKTLLERWPGLVPPHHSVHASGASTSAVKKQKVSFRSGDDRLSGHLFLPPGFDPAAKHQAVIVTGSWTSVKEQMPDVYASRLAERGLVALTFDFAGFGQSAGEPRQLEAPTRKISDIRAALAFLRAQPGVDAGEVAGLGICASAGYMAHAAAADAGFARLVLVAPWLHDEEMARGIYDARPGGADGLIAAGREARKEYEATGDVSYVLAASELDPLSAMYVPNNVFDYYLNPTEGAGPHYDNRFAVASWEGWITFDGISAGASVKQPTLIVHSDQGAVPDGARRFYESVTAKKTVAWLHQFTQEDFYFQPEAVTAAVDRVEQFLRPTPAKKRK